jgi:hypothetical protein
LSIRRRQSNHLSNKFFCFQIFARFYILSVVGQEDIKNEIDGYTCALFDLFICLAGTTPEISTPKGPATGRTRTYWASGPSSANCCLISSQITDRLWPEAEEAEEAEAWRSTTSTKPTPDSTDAASISSDRRPATAASISPSSVSDYVLCLIFLTCLIFYIFPLCVLLGGGSYVLFGSLGRSIRLLPTRADDGQSLKDNRRVYDVHLFFFHTLRSDISCVQMSVRSCCRSRAVMDRSSTYKIRCR